MLVQKARIQKTDMISEFELDIVYRNVYITKPAVPEWLFFSDHTIIQL
jgi:hypothetical protein